MRLLIIDSNALLHRSFHALPPLMDKSGNQTGAIYGYLLTFFKAINDIRPNFVAATFDTPTPTFRHEKFKKYKAKREKAPDEFYEQIPKTKEVLSTLSVKIFEKAGFEADDVIATITKEAPRQQIHPEIEIYILTGDLDTLQLVNKNTKVYTLGRGIKDAVIYDKKKIIERFSLLPKQMVDFKALAGDPSDNIPGATGIGIKTAIELLKKYKKLENLYESLEKKKGENIKPRIKKILIDQKDQIFFSRILVKTREDAPIEFRVQDCKFGNFDEKDFEDSLKKYGFYSLIKRIPELKNENFKKTLEKTNSNGKLF